MSAAVRVGARELKTRLGMYLRRVREARLLRLQAAGLVSEPTRSSLAPLRPVRPRGRSLALAITLDREDRF